MLLLLLLVLWLPLLLLQIVKVDLTLEERKMFLKFFTGSDRWVRHT
jgi:hypothetical protein